MSTIEAFFRTTSEKDLLGCYAWNQAIGARLLPLLADVEVSLRNALHRAVSQYFGKADSFDWMMPRANPVHAAHPTAPPFLPARHKLSPKSKDDVAVVMQKIRGRKPDGYVLTPDDIVAALPLGFWEVLIGGLGHKSQPEGLQEAILAMVFPHAPDTLATPYGSPAFRQRVIDLLKRIREVRNRIGHHDALWVTPEFNRTGVVGYFPRRPRHTVNSLRCFAGNICWFAGWIDPDISTYLRNSDHWWSLQLLLDRQALATYRRLGGAAGTCRTIIETADRPGQVKPRRKHRERLIMQRYFY
ncbi:hypothetical protein [Herbaspirillum sp. NPDC087042]|uniref:hypothetical protein n=1 Tax=Herbaspirillum sp. NPDC087042 TaxID=3364004 RepID=UPI003804F9E7